jgi:hypothetical protein
LYDEHDVDANVREFKRFEWKRLSDLFSRP